MVRKKIIWLSVLLSASCFAAAPVCKPYAFLKSGFNMVDYQQCQTVLANCPMAGGAPDLHCAEKITSKNVACKQIKSLAQVLQANPATLTATAVNNYTIIDQFFPADGQHAYFIISPLACMVKTNIDPRTIDPALKKQYANTDFMMTNNDKPIAQAMTNQQQGFLTTIKVTKTCLACDLLGYAKINFVFDAHGKLIKTELISFGSEN